MLDERSRRRSDFLEGAALRLADGGFWTVPTPGDHANRGRPAAAALESLGPRYHAALEAIREAEDDSERLRAELVLAIILLRRNYDLDSAALQAILSFDDGESLTRMQRAMTDIASAHLRAFRAQRRSVRDSAVARLTRFWPIRALST